MAVTTDSDAYRLPVVPDAVMERAEPYRPPERRWAIFQIDPQLIVELFTPGRRAYEVTEYPIPDGARVVRIQYDPLRDIWLVCVEHPSFDVVAEHAMPPTLQPAVT